MYTCLIMLGVAGLAAAQTSALSAASSVPSSGCGSQIDSIIASCLGTENAQLDACASTDWDCLCTQSSNILVCYNNCPNDPNALGAQQSKIAYCNAASAYGSSASSTMTTTASVTSGLALPLSSGSTASASVMTTSRSGKSTLVNTASSSTTTASATSNSGAGANVAAPMGLAAFFGVLAFA